MAASRQLRVPMDISVSQKCQQVRRRKIRQLEFGDWPVFGCGYVAKERTPSVAV